MYWTSPRHTDSSKIGKIEPSSDITVTWTLPYGLGQVFREPAFPDPALALWTNPLKRGVSGGLLVLRVWNVWRSRAVLHHTSEMVRRGYTMTPYTSNFLFITFWESHDSPKKKLPTHHLPANRIWIMHEGESVRNEPKKKLTSHCPNFLAPETSDEPIHVEETRGRNIRTALHSL